MMNKVYLEGLVTRTAQGAGASTGFFVTIMQKRSYGKYDHTDYFSLYGNDAIAADLKEAAIEGQPLSVEGVLKTYRAKDGQYRTTIEVTKIIKPT